MYPDIAVNLGNLLLSLSDALDLANPVLALHQQRTAFAAWEMCRRAGMEAPAVQRVYLGALLHDVGALSVEEKTALVANETDETEPHCIRGANLFASIPWLAPAAGIVRYHHCRWDNWDNSIAPEQAIECQILCLADYLERHIDRHQYILHQTASLISDIREQSGKMFSPEVVELFQACAQREEFWLDLVSPRLYSLLLHHGPYHQVVIDFRSITIVTRLIQYIIDFKSPFTATHSAGVAECAIRIGRVFGLTDAEVELLEVAGHLHDLGKLVVPNSILEKPAGLTRAEFAIIRQHTYFTFTVLNTIAGLQKISEWAAYHHEKLDGTGYPFHRSSRELDTGARIMAVADVFTALAEDRPYRKRMEDDKIVKVLQELAGREHLDARIVGLLLENVVEIRKNVAEKQAQARDLYERKFADPH